jgi:hypothetical protein
MSDNSIVASDIRQKILDLLDDIKNKYIELGKLLSKVYHEHLYKDWGYETFWEYAEKELKVKARKAYVLKQVYEFMQEYGLMDKKLDVSRAYTLVQLKNQGVVKKENVNEWVEKATKLPVSELKLEAKCKDEKRKKVKIIALLDEEDYEVLKKLVVDVFRYKYNIDSLGKVIAYLALFYKSFNFGGTIEELRELVKQLSKLYADRGIKIFFTPPADDPQQAYEILLDMSASLARMAREYQKKYDVKGKQAQALKSSIKNGDVDKVQREYIALAKKLIRYKEYFPWKFSK